MKDAGAETRPVPANADETAGTQHKGHGTAGQPDVSHAVWARAGEWEADEQK